MEKEYMFHCRGCKKPDKEFPNKEIEGKMLMVFTQDYTVVNVTITQKYTLIEKMNTSTQLMLEND